MDRGDGTIRKRRRALDLPGHAHMLTFSCYKQRPFLSAQRTCSYLADAIRRARDKHALDLWAYVFMPEHVHLLLRPRAQEYSMARIIRSIKQSCARRALRYLRLHNPEGLRLLATGQKHSTYRFWQDGGGYDRNVVSPGVLQNALDYIHGNPVRRGLVGTPQEWRWSSAREWLGLAEGEIPIDRESFPVC